MFDLASIVLGSFQDDLVVVFGDSLGWAIGHAILLSALYLIVIGIRSRQHAMKHSGIGWKQAKSAFTILFLSALLFFVFNSTFGFETVASVALAGSTSVFIGWMVTVLG
ncbi:MAG: hypothetical protein CMB67_01905 [Euryarchaeota archaeon]|nr:hypothetical protein [Euryarchaeota archaeon]